MHDRRRPVRIGLSTYVEPTRWGVWDAPAALLPVTYPNAVWEAGALPVLLPPPPHGAQAPADELADLVACALDGVDGLVITGGPDVDPARYGAQRHPRTGEPHPARDAWEIALAAAAVERDLPLLAICRGLQVLNVALGGDLVQHLPDEVGHDEHSPSVGQHARHEVHVAPGCPLASVLGERVVVATYHHQAAGRLAGPLVAQAWADDGTVEAVTDPSASWVVGVQWHPEQHEPAALFSAFTDAARARSARGGALREAAEVPAARG